MHAETQIILYYLDVHSSQILYKDARKIAKTTTLNFFDFPYDKSKNYHKKTILKKFKTIDFSEEKAEAHIIELPKFKLKSDEELTKKEEWMCYLCGDNKKLLNKIKKQNKYIKQLDDEVCKFWKKEKL